jgi:type 1 glutamine amidotransferase
MRPLILTVLVLAGSAGGAAGTGRLRVLILSGRNNHDWKVTTPALRDIYADTGRFTVDILNDPLFWDDETLEDYDAVVSNWTNYPSRARVWGVDMEEALLAYVRSGGGFVLFHAAGACFPSWAEYQDLIGANWVERTGHGVTHEFRVRVEDAFHPITEGLREFTISDELWHRMRVLPSAHVLVSAFSAEDRGGTGRWEPAAVCTDFGAGRCFYLILGHDIASMMDPGWKTLMLRGTEWAATGRVYPIP